MKCPKCSGTGYLGYGPGPIGIKPCNVCNGTGRIRSKKINVRMNPIKRKGEDKK